MQRRKRIENRLRALAAVPVEGASHDDDEIRTLVDALARLDADPRLLSGDPNGEFTYEDPVLAVASACYRGMIPVGTASHGSELRQGLDLRWAIVAIRALKRRTFDELNGRVPQRVVSFDSEPVRIAVVGDAGYRGNPQDRVLSLIQARHRRKPFDLLIHLGDTYFAGSSGAMLEQFLAPFHGAFGQRAPKIYTLCGNHDLYYGQAPFLAALDVLEQPGRYFCIEMPGFRIACLDTSLASTSTFRNEGELDKGQLRWLQSVADQKPRKGLILMSHHYIISGWSPVKETPLDRLAHQLREFSKREVSAWYWGHEHNCAYYGKGSHGFYGACVGNGAFNERRGSLHKDGIQPDWFAENPCTCFGKKKATYWPHGFLELEIATDRISETYHLEDDKQQKRVLRPA